MTTHYPVSDTAEADVPDGFKRLQLPSPYMTLVGPLYMRRGDGGPAVLAVRVASQHLNIQGVVHGGMLTTLADSALGINISLARGRRGGQVTVSMTADFLSGAREGDWLEAHVVVTRLGQRLAYANCDLKVGERHVLRSSAVFAFVERPLPPGITLPPLQDG